MTGNDETGDAFDDASSWHDAESEEESERTSNERPFSDSCLQHQHKLRPKHCTDKSARTLGSLSSRAPEGHDSTDSTDSNGQTGHSDDAADAPPPTSALVTRMFGAARAETSTLSDVGLKQGNGGERTVNRQGRGRGGGRPDTDRVQKMRKQEAMMQAQVEQLEMEAQKIARDRAALSQQRVALDQRENAFKQRQDEALLKIEQERQEFEAFKADEIRKMKRDRRNQERNAVRSAAQAADEKRLREDLQTQVEALQAAAQAKEARARLQEGRLRSQIDELKKRNSELEGDLAFHEQQRLTRWKAEELGAAGPSSVHAAEARGQADVTKSVLKGIDTRLRDSMERSRGIAEELSRRSWESTGSSIRAGVSDENGHLAHEQPFSGQKDDESRQQQQQQQQQQPFPTHPPTLHPDSSGQSSTSDADAATENLLNRSPPTRFSTSALVGSKHRSDPRSDPHVRGRARHAHDIDQQVPARHSTNVLAGARTAAQTGQDTEEHDDAASVEHEWDLLVKTMPSLTPIGAITPRPPALIFEQHHPDGKHEQVSTSPQQHAMHPYTYDAGMAASRTSAMQSTNTRGYDCCTQGISGRLPVHCISERYQKGNSTCRRCSRRSRGSAGTN